MIITKELNDIAQDKKFIRKMIAITIPIALQALLNTSLNLLDTLMIGSLGQKSIAAVGLEEVYKFILGFRRYRQKVWLRNLV